MKEGKIGNQYMLRRRKGRYSKRETEEINKIYRIVKKKHILPYLVNLYCEPL